MQYVLFSLLIFFNFQLLGTNTVPFTVHCTTLQLQISGIDLFHINSSLVREKRTVAVQNPNGEWIIIKDRDVLLLHGGLHTSKGLDAFLEQRMKENTEVHKRSVYDDKYAWNRVRALNPTTGKKIWWQLPTVRMQVLSNGVRLLELDESLLSKSEYDRYSRRKNKDLMGELFYRKAVKTIFPEDMDEKDILSVIESVLNSQRASTQTIGDNIIVTGTTSWRNSSRRYDTEITITIVIDKDSHTIKTAYPILGPKELLKEMAIKLVDSIIIISRIQNKSLSFLDLKQQGLITQMPRVKVTSKIKLFYLERIRAILDQFGQEVIDNISMPQSPDFELRLKATIVDFYQNQMGKPVALQFKAIKPIFAKAHFSEDSRKFLLNTILLDLGDQLMPLP